MRKIVVAAVIAGAAVVTACSSTSSTTSLAPSLTPSSSSSSATPAPTTPAPTTPAPTTPAPTTPAPTTPAPTTAPAVPECTTADLSASISFRDGSAGSVYYNLTLTNVSNGSCETAGYPGVIAASSIGALGASAVREPMLYDRITLAPGGAAVAQLRYEEAATTTPGCDMTMATVLRIIPPNQYSSLTVPFANQVCAGVSVAIFQVWPVVK